MSSSSRHAIMERSSIFQDRTCIRHLPAELLFDIFQFYIWWYMAEYHDCGKFVGSPYLWMAITHVCHSWREVVMHSPTLWTWFFQRTSEQTHVLSFDIYRIKAAWRPSVTHIYLHRWVDVSIEDVLQLLQESPLIESLELFGLSLQDQTAMARLPGIHLNHLSNIRLHGSAEACASVLGCLSFPTLPDTMMSINCQTFWMESEVLDVVESAISKMRELRLEEPPILWELEDERRTEQVVSATLEFGEKLKFIGYAVALSDPWISDKNCKVFELEIAKPTLKNWDTNFHSELFRLLNDAFYCIKELKFYGLTPHIDFFLDESGNAVLAKHILDTCYATDAAENKLTLMGWHEQLICDLLGAHNPPRELICLGRNPIFFCYPDTLVLESPIFKRAHLLDTLDSSRSVLDRSSAAEVRSVRVSEYGTQLVRELPPGRQLYETLKVRAERGIDLKWLFIGDAFDLEDEESDCWWEVIRPGGGVRFFWS